MECYCFGAGDFYGLENRPSEDTYIVAADGGLKYAEACGLRADCVIGDFDSLGKIPEVGNVKVLPVEKDTTDMYEAVAIGEKHGCEAFHIYGGTGGRIDHTIANLQLLGAMAARGLRGFLYGNGYIITALPPKEKLQINGKKGGRLSVFSLTDRSKGVTLRGLRYPLEDHTLTNTFPLGVSNEFIGQTAVISVRSGILLVYFEREGLSADEKFAEERNG